LIYLRFGEFHLFITLWVGGLLFPLGGGRVLQVFLAGGSTPGPCICI
jgi:hypothetical protein